MQSHHLQGHKVQDHCGEREQILPDSRKKRKPGEEKGRLREVQKGKNEKTKGTQEKKIEKDDKEGNKSPSEMKVKKKGFLLSFHIGC